MYAYYKKLFSRPRSSHSLVTVNYSTIKTRKKAKSRIARSTPSDTNTRVSGKMSAHTTPPMDMTSTCSWNGPFTALASTVTCLRRDPTNENPISPPLRSRSTANDTVQFVSNSYSDRSIWLYQEAVSRVSEELGSQNCTEIDTKIERAVRQQLHRLLPALPETEIQFLPEIARTDWVALLERKVKQMIKKLAAKIFHSLSSSLKVPTGKRMSGQNQSMVNR